MDSLITTAVSTTETARSSRADETFVRTDGLDVYYGGEQAFDDVTIEIPERKVTAIIGPSDCGKSTFLRSINRMNGQIDVCQTNDELYFHGQL